MELMTKDMHILALKTKSETVSMRIITLVTLFFLPGTFISVSEALASQYHPRSAFEFYYINQHFELTNALSSLLDNNEHGYCGISD
jgi:hypothetical protein